MSGLTNLTWLFLDNNQITDISGLSGLTNLVYLDLSYNRISDFSPIADLVPNLTDGYFNDNQSVDPPTGPVDTDGDGVPDNIDAFINDPAASVDTDGDGKPDEWNDGKSAADSTSDPALVLDDDDDNDGVLDTADAFPLISLGSLTDTDGDGRPNDCDSDCQTLGMTADTDDDNDGVLDIDDAFPLDPSETQDSDGDGEGDNRDGFPDDSTRIYVDLATALANLPDDAFRACVQNASNGLASVADVKSIYCGNKSSIRSISGIEAFIELSSLDIHDTRTGDLAPLTYLTKLTNLKVSQGGVGNEISSFEPLRYLWRLEELSISGGSSADWSIVKRFRQLKSLRIGGGNNFLGASVAYDLLEGLELEFLEIWGTETTVLPDLSDSADSLRIVHAIGNQLNDINALSGLTNLNQLRLDNNQITDISGLSGLKNLNQLWIGNNQITDISGLSGLTNLRSLYLYGNQITDISVLSGLTNLRSLYLYGNQITDISGLSGLTNLTDLNLGNTQTIDVSVLSGLTNLTALRLGNNGITDISGLSGLTNLVYLDLSYNRISDFSPITDLVPNLTDGYFNDNQSVDPPYRACRHHRAPWRSFFRWRI